MVVLIPILAIILIFTYRQILNNAPQKSKGASSDDVPIIKADKGYEIDWKIPEPLPVIMRDPAIFPNQKDTTQIEEPNQTTAVDKSELIDLGAIIFSQDRSSAIVNGRIVHAGETVSGITVLKINKESVEFELDGERWVQRIRE
jgi:hypothetical protein